MIAYRNFISEPSPAASSSAVLPAASPCGVTAAVPFYVARIEGADNARIRLWTLRRSRRLFRLSGAGIGLPRATWTGDSI